MTEVEQIEQSLAYSSARSDIEFFCLHVEFGGGSVWYDTSKVDHGDEQVVATAVEYLTGKDLIVKHRERPELILIKDLKQEG